MQRLVQKKRLKVGKTKIWVLKCTILADKISWFHGNFVGKKL